MAAFFIVPDPDFVSRPGPYDVPFFCDFGLANEAQAISSFRVIFATPLNSNTIRVFLTKEPKHITPLAVDDSLNRLNWTVSILSGPGKIPEIDEIVNPRPRPGVVGPINAGGTIGPIPGAWSVDLRLARRILAETTYLTVAAAVIVSADGADVMAPAPDDRDDHPGITVARDPVRRQSVATQNAGVDIRYEFFEGRFVLDPKRDLDVQAGVEFLKKRVIRRLISRPGGFFHLPDYGVGLRVKEPFDATSTAELQARIRRQIQLEEDVERVAVDVAFSAGVLFVRIRIRSSGRRALALDLTVPEDGQVFVS